MGKNWDDDLRVFGQELTKSKSDSDCEEQWNTLFAKAKDDPEKKQALIKILKEVFFHLHLPPERHALITDYLNILGPDENQTGPQSTENTNYPEEARRLDEQAKNAHLEDDYKRESEIYAEIESKFPNYWVSDERKSKARVRLTEKQQRQQNGEKDPPNPYIGIPIKAKNQFKLAGSYSKGGDYEKALKFYEEAIDLATSEGVEFPDAMNALLELNATHATKRMRKEAFDLMRQQDGQGDEVYYQALDKLRGIPDDPKAEKMALALSNLLKLNSTWKSKNLEEQDSALQEISQESVEVTATPLYKQLQVKLEEAQSKQEKIRQEEERIKKAEAEKQEQLRLEKEKIISAETKRQALLQREAETRQFWLRVGAMGIIFIIIVLFVVFTYPNWDEWQASLLPLPTNTPLPSSTPSVTLTFTPTSTVTETPTLTSTVTVTTTSAPLATPTATSTPQVLGIVVADYSAFRSPTGLQEDYIGTLRGGQSVRILRKQSGPQTWYLCEWVNNGLISQGWIQATRVQLLNEPGISEPGWLDITPVPTLSQTPTP